MDLFIKDEDLVQTLNETRAYILNLKSVTETEEKILSIIDQFINTGSMSDKQKSWLARYSYITVKVFKKRTIGVKSKAYKELEESHEIWRERAYEQKMFKELANSKFDFESMKMVCRGGLLT